MTTDRDLPPSFFLLVPGPWSTPEELIDVLAGAGLEATNLREQDPVAGGIGVDVVEDASLGRAFSYGLGGPLPQAVVAAAAACRQAALLQVAMRFDEHPERLARIGRTLRGAGGVAVRVESSGAATPWDSWLAQLESGTKEGLYASAAVTVYDDEDVFFTCGMHAFGLPDAQISERDAPTAIEWLETLCLFQLSERPVLASGHAFRPHAETARRKLERWPDHRHHPDDGRHNPFGLWRVLDEGDPGLEASGLSLTIMPSLITLLLAAERSAGSQLSRDEVERIVRESQAIAVPLAVASRLERSRGYADIEPERAWEQWQIVRSNR